MLLAVTISFMLLVLPHFIVRTLIYRAVPLPEHLEDVTELLFNFNYAINFIIYIMLGKKFREVRDQSYYLWLMGGRGC